MKCPKCDGLLDRMVRVTGFVWQHLSDDGSIIWDSEDQETTEASVAWAACDLDAEHIFAIEHDVDDVVHVGKLLEREPSPTT